MPIDVRNLEYIKAQDPKFYEAFIDIIKAHEVVSQQVNGSSSSNPSPPPAVNGVKVSGAGGHLHVAITDNNQIYRGIQYYVEHADNPQFTDPQIVHIGDTRNATIPVGSQSRYVRVYSAYASSAPSPAVYHGGADPIPVNGGGSDSGPQFLPSEGSGTGTAGQGLSGPGPIPYRTDTGAPPVR
jgi:hypothetical protein